MDAGRITPIIHTTAVKTMTIAQSPSTSSAMVHRSPWHSPVPYLFGGLAAMLGLIAFALLILACSYWRLSGRMEAERDLEAGEESESSGKDSEMKKIEKPVFEEKFLVIMAGQQKPTCLATPMSSRASSFTSTISTTATDSTNVDDEKNKEEESKINLGQLELETIASVEGNSTTNQAHQVS